MNDAIEKYNEAKMFADRTASELACIGDGNSGHGMRAACLPEVVAILNSHAEAMFPGQLRAAAKARIALPAKPVGFVSGSGSKSSCGFLYGGWGEPWIPGEPSRADSVSEAALPEIRAYLERRANAAKEAFEALAVGFETGVLP